MANGMGRKGLGLLIVGALVAAPAVASAHARLLLPVPRTPNDNYKTPSPCGPAAKGEPKADFQSGAQIMVRWEETIQHTGCFQIALSSNNDQSFTVLAQVDDLGNTTLNTPIDLTVKLPDGLSCANCTLVLRQIMLGQVCPNNPQIDPENGSTTYYSCADIRILQPDGGMPDPDPVDEDGGTGSSSSGGTSGGPTTSPSDGGTVGPGAGDDGAPNLRAGQGDDCSVGWGVAAPGASAAMTAFAALALLRRRRRSR
jgi:hypothetical protein